jgi:hypothetical protein
LKRIVREYEGGVDAGEYECGRSTDAERFNRQGMTGRSEEHKTREEQEPKHVRDRLHGVVVLDEHRGAGPRGLRMHLRHDEHCGRSG